MMQWVRCAVAYVLVLSGGGALAGEALAGEALAWPNEISRANSDKWLVDNHDRITQLRPRVLVINYANNKSPQDLQAILDRQRAAFRESTRHRGYEDADAPPFIDYQIEKVVDLADRPHDPRPEGERFEGNSTRYPRIADFDASRSGFGNYRYEVLFSEEYAAQYGYEDPENSDRYLTLPELVDRGIVHEVWLLALHGKWGCPFEGIELKQVYDEQFNQLKGQARHAGNGRWEAQPWIGRSLRIMYLNVDRGPGCFLESWGHCIERMGTSRAVPYFSRYFLEFANLDWNTRHGLNTPGLYGHSNDPIEYPDPSTIRLKTTGGKPFVLENYDAKGGNVHFNPVAVRDYDVKSEHQVYSSIEHFRFGDAPDGGDIKELWDISRFQQNYEVGRDCQGPWLVYWHQNFPGLNNRSKDDDGGPMKNWWPFLFY
jgi:hypothetical protein